MKRLGSQKDCAMSRLQKLVLPSALFLSFLVIYGLTVFPGPGGRVNYGDSVWKQIIPISDCLPHVTGFPQYILLSKLFNSTLAQTSFLQTAAYRIAALSVLFGSLTLVMVFALASSLGLGRLGSLAAALVLGTSYTFWTQATEAELYTLNTFLVATVLWLFIRFHLRKRVRYLFLGCLVYGLSFGTHLSTILCLPGLIFMVWASDRSVFWNAGWISAAAALAVLGATQYLYLYVVYFPDAGLWEFLDFVTGGGWKEQMLLLSTPYLKSGGVELVRLLTREFGLPGLVIIGAGAWRFFRSSRILFLCLSTVLATYIAFSASFLIGDIQVYFLPAYIVMAIFAGCLFVNRRPSRQIRQPVSHAG